MENFVAIDFETANGNRSSICSAGLVVVKDGIIVDKIYRLIRPVPNFYSYWNSKIHGMSYEDTTDADNFSLVWREIEPKLLGLPLIAHNSPFDEGCLKAAYKVFGMEYPDYVFHCTYRTSKKVFGKELPDHKLQTVARHCGYELDNHHHALADAEACAWIARKIMK